MATDASRATVDIQVHLQLNSSGAWKTLSVIGLNDIDRCRTAVDMIALMDKRTGKHRGGIYRLAISCDGQMNPMEYRDQNNGWYKA